MQTGNYYIRFDPSGDYLEEYYNNKPTLATADPVSVTLGGVTSNINATLAQGGKIAGQVTEAGTGAPLSGAYVYAYTSTTSSYWNYVAYAYTNASGVYTITGLTTGNYYLWFAPQVSDYFGEYYNDKPTLAAADPVSVTLGSVTGNINAALTLSGKITGQVTAAGTGAPLPNVYVYAYTSTTSYTWNYVAYDSTDSTGVYTITGLTTGNYYLRFDPPGSDYFEEYYNDKPSLATADPVSVTLGSVTSGINTALTLGGKLTGQITTLGSGTPLEDAFVRAYTNTTASNYVAYDYADASGVYTLTGLATGNYYLRFERTDYLTEYYNDKPTLAAADPVSVTQGSVTSGINAALTLGGKITGLVTASGAGTPLENALVYAYTRTTASTYSYTSRGHKLRFCKQLKT